MTTEAIRTRNRSNWDLLELLERDHPEEVVRISDEIRPVECDHAAVEQYLTERGRFPWIVFDRARTLSGEEWPGVFATCNFNSMRRTAIASGLDLATTTPFDLVLKHVAGMERDSEPEIIEPAVAPVREVVERGDAVRLDRLPFYRNCERDAYPGWQAPMWVTRQLGTGRYNLSWHRSLYLNPQEMTIRFYPGRDNFEYFREYQAAREPMPAVAIIGGHHPAFSIGAATTWTRAVDEYKGVAGIYEESTGSRLRLTPSVLWGDDMLVPADAEIVAEGYIEDRREDTGHWCDVWQNYTPPSKQNVFRVEALTMRKRPMFNSNWPSASIMNSITEPAEIYTFLKPVFPGIQSVSLPYIKTLVISARLQTPALAMNLGASVFALGHDVKTVILVDDDVDPYDLRQVMFSLTSRVDGTRDVQVLPVKAHPNDPSATGPTVGGLIINAMKREDTPEFEIGMPPRAMIDEVRASLDPAILQRIPAGSRLAW